MKTLIIYNEPDASRPDSQDVLDEVASVSKGLAQLGLAFVTVPIASGVELMQTCLAHAGQDCVVVNLVEGIRDNARMLPAAAAAFELAGLRYTGSPYEALMTTTDKTLTKGLLEAFGIPTPAGAVYIGGTPVLPDAVMALGRWIVKPAWEDASVGIDDGAVFCSADELLRELPGRWMTFGEQPMVVEGFVEGRELNIALLEYEGRPQIVRTSEIRFEDWPDHKPRIVNYAAKWHMETFEYENTSRYFDLEGVDVQEVEALAIRVWEDFGLRGYARVDMRLDEAGRPFVIDVNANPCITEDSGYMSSAAQAGLTPTDVIRRIIDAALLPHQHRRK